MPDFTDLISQAKKMQEKMKETQEALKKIEVEGISGGNAVKVIMNGEGELKNLSVVLAGMSILIGTPIMAYLAVKYIK